MFWLIILIVIFIIQYNNAKKKGTAETLIKRIVTVCRWFATVYLLLCAIVFYIAAFLLKELFVVLWIAAVLVAFTAITLCPLVTRYISRVSKLLSIILPLSGITASVMLVYAVTGEDLMHTFGYIIALLYLAGKAAMYLTIGAVLLCGYIFGGTMCAGTDVFASGNSRTNNTHSNGGSSLKPSCTTEWRSVHPIEFNPYTGGWNSEEDKKNGY